MRCMDCMTLEINLLNIDDAPLFSVGLIVGSPVLLVLPGG